MSAVIALVGNPNVGKSTLFNHVTGAQQKVVNAPGTTVHLASGVWKTLGVTVLDLPGTYSLIPQSPDEQVVVDALAGRVWAQAHSHFSPRSLSFTSSHNHDKSEGGTSEIDLVLVVMDGSSLTRSLYLLAQVGQTGLPLAAIVTMADVARGDGVHLDVSALSDAVGIPMIPFDPRNSADYQRLDDMLRGALDARPHIASLSPDPHAPGYRRRVENEGDSAVKTESMPKAGSVSQNKSVSNAESAAVAPVSDMERAEQIFSWVHSVEERISHAPLNEEKPSLSDRVDRVVLHPVLGTLTFFVLLWLLFKIAGEWVGPLQDFFDGLFTSQEDGALSLANGLSWLAQRLGFAGTWLDSLLVDGLVTGLGVVASFFPLMFVIYIALSLLEDSGYMARAAFLGDRLMRKIGLDGRVILPLIMGFGCNLPSLAAARTLPSASQRLITVLITPYTSCAARLTIYLMIAKIFFPNHAGTVVWAMYMISLLLIVASAWVLKRVWGRGESRAPLMLVLPAYHVPKPLVLLRMTWQRAWSFVTGAGKIIVVMTLAVWLLAAIPVGASPVSDGHGGERPARFADAELPMEESLYGRVAQSLEPVFAPTGFGEWHMMGALMTGFVAKETVVSSIVTSYNLDESYAGDAEDGGDDLGKLPDLLHASFTESAGAGAQGLAAFAFLVFVLAYTPCMATVAEQAKIIGGKKAAVAVVVQLGVAWGLATAIFQIGRLFL